MKIIIKNPLTVVLTFYLFGSSTKAAVKLVAIVTVSLLEKEWIRTMVRSLSDYLV